MIKIVYTVDMDISQQIEAILFWKAEPVSVKKLASLLNTDELSIHKGIETLKTALGGRGITLVRTDTEVTLGTAKEFAPLIEQLTKEERVRDLGKAGLETLSIVLYQGPISRADVDYIRGVNSQFIIRNLLVRGLVERVDNPSDTRSYLYTSSIALLSHLGLSSLVELPEYDSVRKDIEFFKQSTEVPERSTSTPDATIE
jgi:segregation and condensation protein B